MITRNTVLHEARPREEPLLLVWWHYPAETINARGKLLGLLSA
jgi:hypothetical protein